ncbi:glycosyltransferase family 1 protein [Lactococcus allomyrinae]|uniref:Glycosyltransferase family 1 protein n=2 Tax=Lactococcus allomyrinae TaxID=2419773 RepID=A0A387BEF5_9LACT|nr:glycosyltransferase family 1 protein [Lactococcus allomyrinae]
MEQMPIEFNQGSSEENMNKKNLVIIIQSEIAGASKYVRDLVENLDEAIFQINLIYNPKFADSAFIKSIFLNKHVVYIPIEEMTREINLKKDVLAFRKINQWMRENKPDIVYCLSSKAGVLGRLAAKRNKINRVYYNPLAYSFMSKGEFSKKQKYLFITIEKFLSRYATTKTIVESEGEKEAAISVGLDREDKFLIIKNAMKDMSLPDKEKIRQKENFPINAYIIGTISRLSEQKNPILFMDIAVKLLKKYPDIHFVWIGDGPLEGEVKNYAKRLGIDSYISFLGYRDDSAILAAAFDAYMSTSLYEGLPYSLMESIRVGVPLFVSNVIGNNEVVLPNKNGHLFELESPNIEEDFSKFKAWQQKNSDENIRQTFLDNFSMDKFIEKTTQELLK